jgi:hypothetical protein
VIFIFSHAPMSLDKGSAHESGLRKNHMRHATNSWSKNYSKRKHNVRADGHIISPTPCLKGVADAIAGSDALKTKRLFCG